MCPFKIASKQWQTLAAAVIALPLLASPQPAAAQQVQKLVPSPTPLILKDGRIAHVSVHSIPFGLKKADLEGKTEDSVQRLLLPLATDCFLTAQAIGHVRPGDSADGDTLSAHRLARARADKIQESLIGLGLPASSVASVWDWQFMVKEPRVTLWVFSLHQGEDCEGKPVSEAVVASLAELERTPPAPPKPAQNSTKPLALTTKDEPAKQASTSKPAPAQADIKVSEIAKPSKPAPEVIKPPKQAAVEKPAKLTEPPPPPKDGGAQIAAIASPQKAPKAPEQLKSSKPALADDSAKTLNDAAGAKKAQQKKAAAKVAAIDKNSQPKKFKTSTVQFKVNSSFFSGNDQKKLSKFLSSLKKNGHFRMEISGAVGTDPVRGGDANEAKKYNLWMAERRVERIAEWVAANAGGRTIEIVRSYRENDPSRKVKLTAKPKS